LVPTIPGNTSNYTGYDLGQEKRQWKKIYCLTSNNDLSDFRLKNSIETLPIEYERFFDSWEPVRYKYNNGSSNRYHTGFIA
jgi:hypothetical protein